MKARKSFAFRIGDQLHQLFKLLLTYRVLQQGDYCCLHLALKYGLYSTNAFEQQTASKTILAS